MGRLKIIALMVVALVSIFLCLYGAGQIQALQGLDRLEIPRHRFLQAGALGFVFTLAFGLLQPRKSPLPLAEVDTWTDQAVRSFEEWLLAEGAAGSQVVFSPASSENCRIESPRSGLSVLRFSDSPERTMNFVFSKSVSEEAVRLTKEFQSSALVCDVWEPGRSALDVDFPVFILSDGVQLGPSNGVGDCIAEWAKKSGTEFLRLQLRNESEFTGVSPPHSLDQELPGAVKKKLAPVSEALERFQVGLPQSFDLRSGWFQAVGPERILDSLAKSQGARVFSVRIRLGKKDDPVAGLRDYAKQLSSRGIAMDQFSQAEVAVKKIQNKSAAKKLGCGLGIILFYVLNPFAGAAATFLAQGMHITSKSTHDLMEKQREDDVLVTLTNGFVADLVKYVQMQRADYYLWRRPLLLVDSRLCGETAAWFNNVLLKDSRLLELGPVILTMDTV